MRVMRVHFCVSEVVTESRRMIRRALIDWQFVGRLALVVLTLTILPVLGGVLLDRVLHTSPVITLFMMLLGFNLGIFAIARNVGAKYAQLENTPNQIQSHSVGGDSC